MDDASPGLAPVASVHPLGTVRQSLASTPATAQLSVVVSMPVCGSSSGAAAQVVHRGGGRLQHLVVLVSCKLLYHLCMLSGH
jgi:hypothetical protein